MSINNLQTGMSNVELTAKVVEKGEVRQVNTRFGPSSVCDAVIEDESGHMTLTLWTKQIDAVKVGDTVEIKGGYVREWRDQKQLSIARSGQINVLTGKAAKAAKEAKKAEPAKEASKAKAAPKAEEFETLEEDAVE